MVLQVSDIHLSIVNELAVAEDLRLFCTETVSTIDPVLVLTTGEYLTSWMNSAGSLSLSPLLSCFLPPSILPFLFLPPSLSLSFLYEILIQTRVCMGIGQIAQVASEITSLPFSPSLSILPSLPPSLPPILTALTLGDLTHAKFADERWSQQFAEEWRAYGDIMKETGVKDRLPWLDIRGNHGEHFLLARNFIIIF